MNMANVQRLITKHEGYRMRVYIDSRGNHTIGIGLNLDDPSARNTCEIHGLNFEELYAGRATMTLSEAEADRDDKILAALFDAQRLFQGWNSFPDDAQAVVLDMIYNLGATRFAEFQHMIAALNANPPDFIGAADQMRASTWFVQTGDRSTEDVALMAACSTQPTGA